MARRVPPLTSTRPEHSTWDPATSKYVPSSGTVRTVLGVTEQNVSDRVTASCLICRCKFKGDRLTKVRRMMRDHFLGYEALEEKSHDKFGISYRVNFSRRYRYRDATRAVTDSFWHRYRG